MSLRACRRASSGRTGSRRRGRRPADRFGEFADGHVGADADIDDLLVGIVLHQENQRVGEIVDIQELAPRRAGAPDLELGAALELGGDGP